MTERRPGDLTFEELLAELEALTGRMASEEVGIEEAAELYERAEQLHRLAAARLAAVQARIDQVTDRATGG